MQPIIMHLDMNSYFASVEQQDNPAWRGKPLGVCEHLGGIIIAASIEAKKWGIKTGTPVWEAKKLYPKIILTPTRPDAYRLYNRRMVRVVSDYTNFVERYSIDEVFADISKVCNVKIPSNKSQITNNIQFPCLAGRQAISNFQTDSAYLYVDPFEEAVRVAQEIKRRMKKEVGDYLTCSIGLGKNKLLAKIGSDLKKPDGVVVITDVVKRCTAALREEVSVERDALHIPPNATRRAADFRNPPLWISTSELYQRLKLIDIPGIGRRQEKNLNALGIKTLLDLKNYPKSHLVSRFGPLMGHHLYTMGQLESSWKPKVEEDRGMKSMGHMYTLPKEYRKPEFFLPVLYKLCEMVGQRLRKQKLMGNVIHFFVSDKNYEGFGQDRKLGFYIYDGHDIFLQAADILSKLGTGTPSEFKLIGITVAGLKPYVRQLSLFGHEEKTASVAGALDVINAKYGGFTICRVPVLKAKTAFKDSIGFGRLKEFAQYKRK